MVISIMVSIGLDLDIIGKVNLASGRSEYASCTSIKCALLISYLSGLLRLLHFFYTILQISSDIEQSLSYAIHN